jgi:hypothetical protein
MAEAKKSMEKKTMDIMEKLRGWIGGITELGLSIIALGVVLQIIFGTNVIFMPIDILGNVIGFVKVLGAEGLVGLIALWILWGIYSKK